MKNLTILILNKASNEIRGKLRRYLYEIKPNIFVGTISAGVREILYEGLKKSNIDVNMILHVPNEQGFDYSFTKEKDNYTFKDFDGIILPTYYIEKQESNSKEVSNLSLDEKSKKLLTRASDRISLLYVEMAKIEQSEHGVQINSGDTISEIPITTIACLILGPGTSITHKAITNISKAGCSICWMGMDQAVFYAYGEPTTNKSKNILKQISYHESKMKHTEVVHKMYNFRYPNDKVKSMTLEQLRGFEGKKMKEIYQYWADEYEIPWSGRKYNKDNFNSSDLTNKYLTALNHILYAITEAIILIMGFSPTIGFIHTGHISSFVFDISDLFKEEITVPLAFKLSKELGYFDRHKMIKAYRDLITEKKVIKRMVNVLEDLFDETETIDVELNIWNSINENED